MEVCTVDIMGTLGPLKLSFNMEFFCYGRQTTLRGDHAHYQSGTANPLPFISDWSGVVCLFTTCANATIVVC